MAGQYQKTELRRQQIARAVLDVMVEQGLRSFTSKAIAERVGLSDGALFKHFRNKDEMVAAAMEYVEALFFEPQGVLPQDPLERMESLFRTRAQLVGSTNSVGRLLFSGDIIHAAGESGRSKVSSWRERNVALFEACFDELAAQGRLSGTLPARARVRVVQGLLLTLFHEGTLVGDHNLEERIQSCWNILKQLLL